MSQEKVIKLNRIDTKTIDYVNRNYANDPNTIIEINNTKDVSSSMINMFNDKCRIRIIGGYTEDILKDRWYKDSYYDAITYTKNETYFILRKMEEIESGILPNWSQLQKTVYLYDKLRSYIVYDKDHEYKDNIRTGDKENRTLRALISRKCVCAGYAVTLKEMLDRQGIENELVIGGTRGNPGNHAWLIVKINGRKFPLDLTWDSGRYRAGNFTGAHNNFINVDEFLKQHIPDMGNDTMDYERELSGLKPEFIERISLPLARDEQYSTTTFKLLRDNGSEAYIAQIGERMIDGRKMYEYAYIGKSENKFSNPVIVYSEENAAALIKRKEIGLTTEQKDYEDKLKRLVFSVNNINDSLRKNTNYIGGLSKINGTYYLRKDVNLYSRFGITNPTRVKQFRRGDGSEFVLQSGPSHYIDGKAVKSYDCCEFILDSDKRYNFKKTKIFSEQDLLTDSRWGLANSFLSRERISRLAKQNGGYVGTYSNGGTCFYDDRIKKAFQLKRMNWTKDDIKRPDKYVKVPCVYSRSDGSSFTITRMHANPREIKRNHLVQYEYKESVPKKGGGTIFRKKYIYAQDDLETILRDPNVRDNDFSRDKLSNDNLSKTGNYIGKWNPSSRSFVYDMNVAKFFVTNKGIDFTSSSYGEKIKKIYKRDTKRIKRSDGTSLKLRKIASDKEIKLYGRDIYQYEYTEDVKIAPWIRERRKMTLFSEEDLFKEKRQDVIDYLLSQKRIQRQHREAGGYLGYYDEKGKRNVVGTRKRFFQMSPRDFRQYPDVCRINEEELQEKTENITSENEEITKGQNTIQRDRNDTIER